MLKSYHVKEYADAKSEMLMVKVEKQVTNPPNQGVIRFPESIITLAAHFTHNQLVVTARPE